MSNQTVAKFKAGETYGSRSICDHNTIFSFKVVRRTAKTIWVTGEDKQDKALRIKVWDGEETVKPLGSYSMAPVLRASRPLSAI